MVHYVSIVIIRECHQNQVDIIEDALKTLANLLENGISIGARTVNGFGRIASEDIFFRAL